MILSLLLAGAQLSDAFELALDRFDSVCVAGVVQRLPFDHGADDGLLWIEEPAVAVFPDGSSRQVDRCGFQTSVSAAPFESYSKRVAARFQMSESVPVKGGRGRSAAWSKRLPDGRYLNISLRSPDDPKLVSTLTLSLTRIEKVAE
ncbi:hypothetical protein GON01_10830 [Sphingomonas sp. MAH-20]|uniref:Uncharacterized protein n=1 Tax=Sphingomonas horti TaxID=2682842 RepID=A0A6I4J1X2_9SPHN|nr:MULTISPECIES: hypothetical protein [Sphingomonas]MBA2919545.1 hypothetical protein [Sphingomonas sp. CGMCC 1.13658]MVO78425.1 hypothetical protein [Sphingomonas horti]